MSESNNAQVLRIYMNESYYHETTPVYEYLIYQARDMEMAGATLTKGPVGFGQEELKEGIRYKLSNDIPIVLEIVDISEKVEKFLPIAQKALAGRGLIIEFSASIR
ncbi:MAG: DUF190 domain-containing protein [Micavibrio sp.]|nr:MAG: DUF190 domain-containing protein [Micavibrio sp.]